VEVVDGELDQWGAVVRPTVGLGAAPVVVRGAAVVAVGGLVVVPVVTVLAVVLVKIAIALAVSPSTTVLARIAQTAVVPAATVPAPTAPAGIARATSSQRQPKWHRHAPFCLHLYHSHHHCPRGRERHSGQSCLRPMRQKILWNPLLR
jgi:hypothetical protein